MLVTLALVFVCLRGCVRYYRRQRPMASDYFVLVAWLMFVSSWACDIKLKELGLFENHRTYEDPLSTINNDPYLTIEALKVPILEAVSDDSLFTVQQYHIMLRCGFL